jgi:hypothetical protein
MDSHGERRLESEVDMAKMAMLQGPCSAEGLLSMSIHAYRERVFSVALSSFED